MLNKALVRITSVENMTAHICISCQFLSASKPQTSRLSALVYRRDQSLNPGFANQGHAHSYGKLCS